MWHNEQVTHEPNATLLAVYQHAESVAQAVKAHQAAKSEADAMRTKLFAEIVAAKKAGVRSLDLIKLTGYSTEYLRQIVLKADAEQEPTT